MLKHGTPLDLGQAIHLGSTVLNSIPRDLSHESQEYWGRHGQELKARMREIMLRPGSRVIAIDRTQIHSTLSGYEVAERDPKAEAVEELDLSQVRFVPYKDLSPRHVHLDEYVVSTLWHRQADLPRDWPHLLNRKSAGEAGASFLGVTFRSKDEPHRGRFFHPHLWGGTDEKSLRLQVSFSCMNEGVWEFEGWTTNSPGDALIAVLDPEA